MNFQKRFSDELPIAFSEHEIVNFECLLGLPKVEIKLLFRLITNKNNLTNILRLDSKDNWSFEERTLNFQYI